MKYMTSKRIEYISMPKIANIETFILIKDMYINKQELVTVTV